MRKKIERAHAKSQTADFFIQYFLQSVTENITIGRTVGLLWRAANHNKMPCIYPVPTYFQGGVFISFIEFGSKKHEYIAYFWRIRPSLHHCCVCSQCSVVLKLKPVKTSMFSWCYVLQMVYKQIRNPVTNLAGVKGTAGQIETTLTETNQFGHLSHSFKFAHTLGVTAFSISF